MVKQYSLRLPALQRGFHLVTDLVLKAIDTFPQTGIMQVFIKHTSAGLAISENADPSVRTDLNNIFDQLIPENAPFYTHTYEGPDDMPSHAKSILSGSSLSIPIKNGRPDLGTWQGIYLCEFRDRASGREITITVLGE